MAAGRAVQKMLNQTLRGLDRTSRDSDSVVGDSRIELVTSSVSRTSVG